MTEAGSLVTPLTGWELLADPLLNKGTAFTEAERDALGLHGLLPPHIGTLEEQVSRRLAVLRRFASDLERYAFLSELHDNNETLFFALLEQNLEELLPLVYTPTVGGCQQFSQLFRKPRGLFLSLQHQRRLKQILSNPRFDQVEAIVLTTASASLGSATRAPAAWASRSVNSRCTQPAAVFIRRRPSRSCSMSAPTIRNV
jgi:malate dehydrogenase (oxaloacetate-decarboxylating)